MPCFTNVSTSLTGWCSSCVRLLRVRQLRFAALVCANQHRSQRELCAHVCQHSAGLELGMLCVQLIWGLGARRSICVRAVGVPCSVSVLQWSSGASHPVLCRAVSVPRVDPCSSSGHRGTDCVLHRCVCLPGGDLLHEAQGPLHAATSDPCRPLRSTHPELHCHSCDISLEICT